MTSRDDRDPDRLMDRVTDRLIEIERARLLRRRRVRLLLIGPLVVLVVVIGLLVCWRYGDELIEMFQPTRVNQPATDGSTGDR